MRTRNLANEFSMICTGQVKAGKKNLPMTGCKNFQQSALVWYMNEVNHKSTAAVLLQQQQFKASRDNAG